MKMKKVFIYFNQKIEKKGFGASISLDYGIKELISSFNSNDCILSDNKENIQNVKFTKSI